MKHKNIPKGYKDSPLGIIPKEWEIKRLGEICSHFKSGTTITSKQISEKGKYPVYGGNGLRGYSDTYTHEGTYVLIGRQGALCGNINYVEGRNYISEHAIAVQSFEHIQWLKYKLDYWNLNKFSESSAQPGLSVEKLVRYKLIVPPITEQKRIAELLSVWDEAIDKQTKLIGALIRRKRRLMQLLFTIPKQMKEISKKQEKVRLGDVCNIYSNNTFSREQLNYKNGNIQNIHYGDVLIKFSSILDVSKTNLPFINDSILQKYSPNNFVCEGDIIIADTAEDETVGKACEVIGVGNKKIISGLHTIWLRPQKDIFVPGFLGYYINSTAYHKQLLPLMQGIKVSSISKQAISNTLLATPSPEEQTAIVKILTQADLEIELKQKYLDIIQTQKHGLLQQLLTGKKRIK